MSGDSPTTEHKEPFSYTSPGGRSTPPPTTSHNMAEATTASVTTAAIAGEATTIATTAATAATTTTDDNKEQDKDKDKEKNDDFSSPDANPGYKYDGKSEGGYKRGEGGNKDGDAHKMNGHDKLDGQWMRALDAKAKDAEESEEDGCVKCLYYTMQCCECTIT